MSIQAISWVLDHSPTRGADRLVLISLANHAGKESVNGAWECWPGVALIAQEAGLERARTVQEALARLEKAGAIQRLRNAAPDERIRKDRRPNLYRILTTNGVSADVTPAPAEPGSRGDAGRHAVAGERGDASRPDGVTVGDRTGCRETSPEPSLKPSGNRVRRPWEPESRIVAADKSMHPELVRERLRIAAEGRAS